MTKCVVCQTEITVQDQGRCQDALSCLNRGCAKAQQDMNEALSRFFTGNDYAFAKKAWLEARDRLDYLMAILAETEITRVDPQKEAAEKAAAEKAAAEKAKEAAMVARALKVKARGDVKYTSFAGPYGQDAKSYNVWYKEEKDEGVYFSKQEFWKENDDY